MRDTASGLMQPVDVLRTTLDFDTREEFRGVGCGLAQWFQQPSRDKDGDVGLSKAQENSDLLGFQPGWKLIEWGTCEYLLPVHPMMETCSGARPRWGRLLLRVPPIEFILRPGAVGCRSPSQPAVASRAVDSMVCFTLRH